MANAKPKVSIGMPVYNAHRFLREVIDSILAQTFTDFELIISDNGSTDETEEICLDYVRRDPRVRYYPNDRINHGPGWNYNNTEALASGEYFRWAAADDLLAPTLLEKLVAALDANPDAVMAWPRTRIIDDQGKTVRDHDFDSTLATSSPEPQVRFGSLINVNHKRHGAFEIFSLIRLAAVRSFPRKGSYARADSVVLARLSLFGRFHQVPEYLFLNRDHGGRSVRSVPTRLTRGRSRLSKYIGVGPIPPTEWWDPTKKGKICFPEWRVLKEYWASPPIAPLKSSQRLACCLRLALFTIRVLPKLARDVVIAVEELWWRAVENLNPEAEELSDSEKLEPPAAPTNARA
jgi:glycosyltransferase involved in cell wall biosynthesis